MQNTSKSSLRGYLTGVGATVFLSFTGILISYLNKTYNLPSLVLAFWRDSFAVIGLIVAFTVGRYPVSLAELIDVLWSRATGAWAPFRSRRDVR